MKDDNQSVYDAHFKTDYFTALGETIQKEGLLAGPLDIKTIKPIGGFASR
jgi:quinol monooxygenase YgiN